MQIAIKLNLYKNQIPTAAQTTIIPRLKMMSMAIRCQTCLFRLPFSPSLSHFCSSTSLKIFSVDITDNSLVNTTVSILSSHRSRSRWNFLKSILPSSGISPSESSAVILRLRNNPRLALRFFLWSRDRSLCLHTLTSYATIIHTLARSRLRSLALSLIRDAIRSHPDASPSSLLQTLILTYRPCDSAPFVFDLLIQAYLHSNNLGHALSILRSHRGPILTSTSNSLLRTAARIHGSNAAIDLFHEIFLAETPFHPRPNPQTFNTLILALYRDGRADSKVIMTEMNRFGCEPNRFTYNILMAGCFDTKEAQRIWNEMKAKGIKPDAMAYNTLMRWYCESRDMRIGKELYQEMVMEGVDVTGTTMEILIRGYCLSDDVTAAKLVYKDMTRRGLSAGDEIVEVLIEGLCGKQMIEEGLRVLRDGNQRRRRSYGMIIKGLCEDGRMEEAVKLQAEMAGRGMGACTEIYEAFICGYEKVGEFEKVEMLRKEMAHMRARGEGD